jgi:3-oxoadipate enol-lactonase
MPLDAPGSPTPRPVHRKSATADDGTHLSYEVIGDGPRTLLLANGLGGRLYAWDPLIDAFADEYRLITWDYRGLFDSGTPASRRRLSLIDHVDDARAILRAESCERAVFVGWSMGVQVSLDLAATHPELCAGLVLLNGTYGHALSTGFQPLVAVPGLPRLLHFAIETAHGQPALLGTLAQLARLGELPATALFSLTAGARSLALRPVLRRYMDDVLGGSFDNFLRLFQELDAHSVYHLLPEIEAPTLVVSGLLDLLTPARQSWEIHLRLHDSRHLALVRASHFALLERPEVVVPAVRAFLAERARFDVR